MHQGWKRNGPHETEVDGKAARNRFHTLKRLIQHWIYTWMKPGYCETKEEYKISKQLLFYYLRSKKVFQLCGQQSHVVRHLVNFVKKHCIRDEQLYVFYRRMYIRYLDIAHNSCHEGTNFGAKAHASALKPTLDMLSSAEVQTLQAYLKVAEIVIQAYKEYTRSKTWSKSATSDFLVTMAEGILKGYNKEHESYVVARVGHNTFEVKYIPNEMVKKYNKEQQFVALEYNKKGNPLKEKN